MDSANLIQRLQQIRMVVGGQFDDTIKDAIDTIADHARRVAELEKDVLDMADKAIDAYIQRDTAEASLAACRALVQDVADNGLRFSTSPCLDWTSKESIHAFWADYFRRADASIRERASKALRQEAT